MNIFPHSRSFLFLQGPISPFFNELAHEFCREGYHRVHKLRLCESDSLWWDFSTIDYRGKFKDFERFITKELAHLEITDILLLGDCRPYHAKAIEVAKKLNIDFWVFEEGYIRPDTITLEHNKYANARNQTPSDKSFYENYQVVRNYPLIRTQNPVSVRLRWDLVYHLKNGLSPFSFRNYNHHRQVKIYREYIGWIIRFSKKFFTDRLSLPSKLEKITDKKFFLVPLQLSHDYQILEHSKYQSTLEMIDEVLISFAKNANDDTLLVFKLHPFDTMVVNSLKHIQKSLKKHPSIKSRVITLDGGHLPTLIDNSLGVVVINSTVGLQSLAHGKPTKALGRAIYNFEGLVDTQHLDSFWLNPQKPDKGIVINFKRYLLDHNQFNGSFYSKHGISIAVPFVAHKILGNQKQ
ncbi:capsular biosynthesis protein [Francisella philomiragia]|uniref:capsular polysaccharide export protein, LipB/KpsS family n=1 Tax=Francisella philomiragia TaxID=28110 RepID=UPI003512D018